MEMKTGRDLTIACEKRKRSDGNGRRLETVN